MSSIFIPLISSKYYFSEEKIFRHYNPKKLKVKAKYRDDYIQQRKFATITSLKLEYYSSVFNIPPDYFPSLLKLVLTGTTLVPPFPPKLRSFENPSWQNSAVEYPDTLTHLIIPCYNDYDVQNVKLPQKLTHFYTDCFHTSSLPKTLTHLISDCLLPIYIDLPNLQKIFQVGHWNAVNLVNTLTTIKFWCYFNDSIEPLQQLTNLRTIHFGSKFNQPINLLPISVTHLQFEEEFELGKLRQIPAGILIVKLWLIGTRITFDFCQVCSTTTKEFQSYLF